MNKNEIIMALMPIFIEKGYRSFKIDDIAAELKISKRTLYDVFGDKKNLIKQVITTHIGILNQILTESEKKENLFEAILFLKDQIFNFESVEKQIQNNYELQKYYKEIYDYQSHMTNNFVYKTVSHLIERGKRESYIHHTIKSDILAIVYAEGYHIFTNNKTNYSNLPENYTEIIYRFTNNFIRGCLNYEGVKIWDKYAAQIVFD